jgi:hypothetical protein
MAVTGFELNVANLTPVFQREIVATAVDFGAKDCDICNFPLPESPQEIAEEDMLDPLLAGARIRVMQRVDLRNLILILDLGHSCFLPNACTAIRFPWRGSPRQTRVLPKQR